MNFSRIHIHWVRITKVKPQRNLKSEFKCMSHTSSGLQCFLENDCESFLSHEPAKGHGGSNETLSIPVGRQSYRNPHCIKIMSLSPQSNSIPQWLWESLCSQLQRWNPRFSVAGWAGLSSLWFGWMTRTGVGWWKVSLPMPGLELDEIDGAFKPKIFYNSVIPWKSLAQCQEQHWTRMETLL